MHSGKITSLWTLLALAATIVSGLPITQVDDDDFDCGPWDDEADPTASAVYTSNTATITPTPLILLPSAASSSSSLRISTSLAQASPTGSPSSTNSFIAPANSFIPVTPPSYAFYIQSSSSGNSNGLYAAVSAGVGGLATLTANKNAATRFTIDSSGDLVEQRPSQGYVARLDPQINAQQVAFDIYGRLNCQRQGGEVSCNVGGVPYQAAVCGNDGKLYFTRTAAIGCTAIKLVPVFS
ncbi:hypothetical protein E4T44_02919 [Aureobasidium sp. EXF-8845]|nr:hypothetical protein E4T44_02919 [Aureobasidium sp. EXF-8845]KAI4855320.1 hypothetical protein E4T45_03247 [Aureobasidium sp. EXF-8846]